MNKVLHIEGDDTSTYGTVTIEGIVYKFQRVYREHDMIVRLDKNCPNYFQWLGVLTAMLIEENLI